jgi:hypothetical protein
MISNRLFIGFFLMSLSSYACSVNTGPAPAASTDVKGGDGDDGDEAKPNGDDDEERRGPGADATDKRTPELGDDLGILKSSKLSMAEALAQSEKTYGPSIEAKFELNDEKKLSLSLYPVGKGIAIDPENNEFQELSGDPTVAPWQSKLDIFQAGDFEHLTRSTRDLTLVQLSRVTLGEAVSRASKDGFVYWAIPTIEKGRAGYGVYTLEGTESEYQFIDGNGSRTSTAGALVDLGTGPGAAASDTRTPEVPDLSVLATSKISMAQGLMQAEATNGPAIEAKFEIDDSGKLSLSVYPVGKGITTDPENNEFQELSGDPTAATWAPKLDVFQATDFEHITRSSRDLTLVQTASLTLRQAVDAAQAAVPGGFVYWAIPTIRDTRSGYGVYVYGPDKKVHYFFVS